MEKIDFKKKLKAFYSASAEEPVIVDVPVMNYLMIDGMGDPNKAQEYQEAMEALFSVAYALKFMIKKGELAIDYGVLPLEGLWWADDMSDFIKGNKDKWKWTMMIMQPEYVTVELFNRAIEDVKKKKNPAALYIMRFESFTDGLSAQIMHIGPYDTEGPTIEKLHHFIHEKGYKLRGKHREIYLSDVRKAAPEKLKTIIRQPL
ncbi:hypothetical protein ES703_58024 [subsurface metagenome]